MKSMEPDETAGVPAGSRGVSQVVSRGSGVVKSAPSAFNQLVEQLVAESTEPAPTPAVPVAAPQTARAKLPPISIVAPDERLPDFPASPLPEQAILPTTPPSGRSQNSRSVPISNTGNKQPAPVDVNVPIPIAPRLLSPPPEGGDSTEPRPVTVLNTEEPALMTLAPMPLLEVNIHLNAPESSPQPQTVKPHVVAPAAIARPVDTEPAESAVATRAVQPETPAQPSVTSTKSAPAVEAAIQSSAPNGQNAEGCAGEKQNPEKAPPAPEVADATPPVEQNPRAAAPVPAQQEAPFVAQHPVAFVEAAPLVSQNSPDASTPISFSTAATPTITRTETPEPVAGAATVTEPPLEPAKAQQPLRSMALEFSPDGASDIKVRLSERGGDVHISLHGTDPSLAGRVREGVGDLVGSLSKAGYDAEAWTPSEGRHNQGRQPEQRQSARGTFSSSGADAEEFSGLLQLPVQEVS